MKRYAPTRFEALLGKKIGPPATPPDLPDFGKYGHTWVTACLVTGISLAAMVEGGTTSRLVIALMFLLGMIAPWVAYRRRRLRGRHHFDSRSVDTKVQRSALLGRTGV